MAARRNLAGPDDEPSDEELQELSRSAVAREARGAYGRRGAARLSSGESPE